MDASKLRIGIGHDTHRLGDGGPLIIGGVSIEYERHLIGHSDADVLLHAITDAILGAAGMGDIGELFPDTHADNKNRDSAEMLSVAAKQVYTAGYRITNLDCTIFAQKPKLSSYKPIIQNRIAEILALEPNQVNVKAKTGENVGPVGLEQAMMAEAICLLYNSN